MKSRLKTYLLTIIFTAIPFTQVGMVAHAEEGTGGTGSGDSGTTQNTDDKKTLEQRLADKKAKLAEKVSAAEQAKLKSRCKNSQGKLTSTSSRIKGVKGSRDKVYGNLVERLTKLSEKIKAKGLDTSTLDGQITELKKKIDAFKTSIAEYEQTIADLVAMDCAADPEAFKAALEAARTGREALVAEAKAIKDYVNNTIKPTLKDLKKQLETQESSDGADDNSNDGTGGTTNGQ